MEKEKDSSPFRGTTILSVRKAGRVVVLGDGQVTMGHCVAKSNAYKLRSLLDGKVLLGFAGATADAFTLLERLEEKLEKYPEHLQKACVALAKDWRTDKYLRKLDAMMVVVDAHHSFILTGQGDVLEPEDGIIGIGSGGVYALSAARALKDIEGLSADDIAQRAMKIAGDLCIYTNHNVSAISLSF